MGSEVLCCWDRPAPQLMERNASNMMSTAILVERTIAQQSSVVFPALAECPALTTPELYTGCQGSNQVWRLLRAY